MDTKKKATIIIRAESQKINEVERIDYIQSFLLSITQYGMKASCSCEIP